MKRKVASNPKESLLAEMERQSPLSHIRDSNWSPLSRLLESGLARTPIGQLMGNAGEQLILSDKDSEEREMTILVDCASAELICRCGSNVDRANVATISIGGSV